VTVQNNRREKHCANRREYGFITEVKTGGEVIFLPGERELWQIGADKLP
jgi:hypothetical protein